MSAREWFPHGCGAGGVQETCGAGDAEQVIGVGGVEQAAQVGIGNTGDVIGDVLAADEGRHSRLVGSQRLLTGLEFAFVAAAGGATRPRRGAGGARCSRPSWLKASQASGMT